ncbi:MAG: hypothetical protein R2807_08000 [Chitinophagales bacterium]
MVEGANGIYTNKNTYAVLLELKKLKMEIPNLIALPDFTACSILHTSITYLNGMAKQKQKFQIINYYAK